MIVTEGLHDRQYIEAHVSGFDALSRHIREFTPEEMAPICGIEADRIREVARTYARAERGIIFWGMGISQHTHGTDNARCLIALSMITGHVGRPGTGLHPLRGQNNVQGASDAGLIPMVFPDYQSVEAEDIRARFEDLWGRPLDAEKGLTVVEIMDAVHAGEITGMYIMGENPAMSDPDTAHARAGLAMLEHLVVQDIFLTETAFHADVVLPASAWPEKDGTVTNTNRQVQMGRTALALPGDARQDWWIIQEIARRIGLDWRYGGPADVYEEMKSVMPSLDNISWERLWAESAVTYPCEAPDKPGMEIVFGDGYPTPDGRARLVPPRSSPPTSSPTTSTRWCSPRDGSSSTGTPAPSPAGQPSSTRSSRRPSRACRRSTCASSASPQAIRSGSQPAAAPSSSRPGRTARCRPGSCSCPSATRKRRPTPSRTGPGPDREDPGVQVLRRRVEAVAGGVPA